MRITIVSYEWQESSVPIASGVSPVVTLSVAVHTIDLTVTDDDSATDTDSVVVTVNPAAGIAFQQDSGADGLVSMEAENFDANTPQGDHTWEFVTAPAGYSGAGAMLSQPGLGDKVDTGYETNSPRLDFQVNFVKTGVHYMWVRGYATGGGDDSCHGGLDGVGVSTADRISNIAYNVYDWASTDFELSERITVDVTSTGLHTVNIWMRESHFIVDKVVLTTNVDYTPSGDGPAESPRGGANDPPIADAGPDQNVTDNDDNGSEDVTLDGSGSSDPDGTITAYDWQESSVTIATGVSPTVALAVGVHTIDLIVTDDDSATDTDTMVATVDPAPVTGGDALLVVGSVSLNDGDAAVMSMLEAMDYTVTVVDDAASTTGDATGMDLVVLSSTVNSNSVADKFRDVTVPVLNWEQALQDDMEMVDPGDSGARGTVNGQTQVAIVDSGHAMAAGLSGNVTVYSSSQKMSWGKPNGNAQTVAVLTGDSTRVVVYGYEIGAGMYSGLNAPARRVHLFLENNGAAYLATDGVALFEAAVDWAVGQ